ncbi:MAG: trp operon repressor [Simkaniaceae bacterium]
MDLKNWREFLNLCLNMKNSEELDKLFQLFLTHEEREDIVRRYLLIKELLKGDLTQREIAEKLGISIAKITRGSNALKIVDPKFKEELFQQMKKT